MTEQTTQLSAAQRYMAQIERQNLHLEHELKHALQKASYKWHMLAGAGGGVLLFAAGFLARGLIGI